VGGFYKLVVFTQRQTLGIGKGRLELAGEFIHTHSITFTFVGF
jgi:hypothetical protein